MPTDRRHTELVAAMRLRVARLLAFRPREIAALVVLGALVLVAAVVSFARSRPVSLPAPSAPTVAPAPSATAARILVHVAGAVRRPGVYEFAPGSRVVDALRAAGGALAGADPDALNLARPLADGERVYVPRRGEAPPPDPSQPGAGGAESGNGKVNLNTATEAQLESLPGVGPVLAQRIIDYRAQHGPFHSVRDLLKIEGIGQKKFASIEPLVTV